MPWSRVLSFSDPFPCQAALQSVVQAEILPTARGSFHVDMTQISMNKLRMQRFDVVLPQISTVEIASDRKLIGFLAEPCSSYPQHCGMEVTPDDIFVYGYDVLHQRSGSDYHIGTMSVPAKDFPLLCKTIVGREFLEEPRNAVVRPALASMSRLRKLHNAVGQLAQTAPDLLAQPEVCRALEEQLIHAMVQCLAEGAGVEPTTGGRSHDAMMVRFEEFLEANSDRPLYLAEICAAIGVAERTLRAACEEHLGMGPVSYTHLRAHDRRPPPRCHDGAVRGILGGQFRPAALSRRNLRGHRCCRADASRRLRGTSGHGTDSVSHPAPNAPCAACSPGLGCERGKRHPHRHGSRLLGAWPFFGGLPSTVRRISLGDIAASCRTCRHRSQPAISFFGDRTFSTCELAAVTLMRLRAHRVISVADAVGGRRAPGGISTIERVPKLRSHYFGDFNSAELSHLLMRMAVSYCRSFSK